MHGPLPGNTQVKQWYSGTAAKKKKGTAILDPVFAYMHKLNVEALVAVLKRAKIKNVKGKKGELEARLKQKYKKKGALAKFLKVDRYLKPGV